MPRYNLDALGWFQFEQLAQSLLKAELGIGVESWGGRGDRGRDAYSTGPHRFPDRRIESPGPFIFQAKFVSGANGAGSDPLPALKKAVRAELKEITKRQAQGEWDDPRHYVLVTNCPITSGARKAVSSLIEVKLSQSAVTILGASDLDDLLDSNSSVRVSFPQLLGLRDLKVLLEDVVRREHHNRSNLTLERYAKIAPTFVPIAPYSETLETLEAHALAVLVGPPEVGKTTIARMVALARRASGWDAFECNSPAQFFELFDRERRQIFVADDAFGTTEYDPRRSAAWARELGSIVPVLKRRRHEIVFTSRTGPLTAALRENHFEGEARMFPAPGRVHVEVGKLKRLEKALILYRHCKAEGVSDDLRGFVREEWASIVDNPHFTPLRIARLVTDQLPEIVDMGESERDIALKSALAQSLAQPSKAFETSFRALTPELKRFLVALVDAGPNDVPREDVREALERHRSDEDGLEFEAAAELLADHFINAE